MSPMSRLPDGGFIKLFCGNMKTKASEF